MFDCEDEQALSNERIFSWAMYAEGLVPLRLPFYLIWDTPILSGDNRTVLLLDRTGVEWVRQNPTENHRWAEREELDIAHVVWKALHDVGESDLFVTDPPPLPTSARNCAIAFVLWHLDLALADQYAPERMCETLSMVGLMLAAVAEDVTMRDARVASAETAAQARWEGDPSRSMWKEVRAEWDRWQLDRSLFRYPRDFRRAMQLRFPDLVDGTLKNRMSGWGRGES